MNILQVHNYHAGRGGMEVIFDYTSRVLRDHDHTVIELTRDSSALTSPRVMLGAFARSVYSVATYRETRRLIDAHRLQLAFIHNLYPMLSTSVLDACRDAEIPVVMNIQDYKLTCPMGRHLRGGKNCTKCMDGSVAWSAIHACKGGRVASAAYAVSHGITRARRAYQRGVALFVTPTQFSADYLVRAGFDRDTIAIVPSMCDLPVASPADGKGAYAAFVGRISPEKGVDVLIEAARLTGIPTRIAGTGDLGHASFPENVQLVGGVGREALPDFYRNARFLVVPSIWNEVFGVVVVEAMMMGIPVIASAIGGLGLVFKHEQGGLLVRAGDVGELSAAMRRLWNDADECRRQGHLARDYAQRHFTPQAYYQNLMAAFERALQRRCDRVGSSHADTQFAGDGVPPSDPSSFQNAPSLNDVPSAFPAGSTEVVV